MMQEPDYKGDCDWIWNKSSEHHEITLDKVLRVCQTNQVPSSEWRRGHNWESKTGQRKMLDEDIIGILQEQHLGLQIAWKRAQAVNWKKVCARLHHCEIVCKKQHIGDQWQHHLLWGILHKSNSSEDEWTITLKASKTFIHFKLDTGAHDGVLIEIMLSSWQEADNGESGEVYRGKIIATKVNMRVNKVDRYSLY